MLVRGVSHCSLLALVLFPAAAEAEVFVANLDGAQTIPPSGSAAIGTAAISLLPSNALTYYVRTSGLTGAAAHIHTGLPGVAGGIVVSLAGGPAVWSGTSGPLSAANVAKLKAGELYVDVHTPSFGGGEIRGQIVPAVMVVNEALYDTIGPDDSRVFVELGGPPGFDISGYETRFVAGSGGTCGTLLGSTVLPASSAFASDGLFVIADADAGGNTNVATDSLHNGGAADLVVINFDPPDGPNSIQFLTPAGQLLDVVGYGAVSCATDASGNATAEGSPTADPPSGHSIARNPHLGDTGSNATDFASQLFPTPGAPATTFAPNIPQLDFAFNGLGATSFLSVRNGPPSSPLLMFLAFDNGPGIPVGGTTGLFLLGSPVFQLFIGLLDGNGEMSVPIAYPSAGIGPYFAALQGIAVPASGNPTWTSNIVLTEGSCPCTFLIGQSAAGVAEYIDYQSEWKITISGAATCSLFPAINVGVVYVPASGGEVLLHKFLYVGGAMSQSGFKAIGPGDRIQFRCFSADPTADFSTSCSCYVGLLAEIKC